MSQAALVERSSLCAATPASILADLLPPGGRAALSPAKREVIDLATEALTGSAAGTVWRDRIHDDVQELINPAPSVQNSFDLIDCLPKRTLRTGLVSVLNELRKDRKFFGALETNGLAAELCRLELNGKKLSDESVTDIWHSLVNRGCLPSSYGEVQQERTKVSSPRIRIVDKTYVGLGVTTGLFSAACCVMSVLLKNPSISIDALICGALAYSDFSKGLRRERTGEETLQAIAAQRMSVDGAACFDGPEFDSDSRFCRAALQRAHIRANDTALEKLQLLIDEKRAGRFTNSETVPAQYAAERLENMIKRRQVQKMASDALSEL